MPRNSLSLWVALVLGLGVLPACNTRTALESEEKSPSPPPAVVEEAHNVDSLTIAAVGDIMLGSAPRLPPNEGADILKEVTPILASADIAFGNLEGPMLEGGVSTKCAPTSKQCFAFRVPTRYGRNLKDAGFDVLSLANNHAGDFGEEGRASTRKVLDDLGIKHAGSDKAQFALSVVVAKGRKVAFIAFGHNDIVPNVNDLAFARQLVEEAAKKADLVVVSFHGGAEGTDSQHVPQRTEIFLGEARGNLPLFARAVIDAGADLVLGHGPHVLRGMEIYQDRLIAYSMGNFATYGMFSLVAETGLTAIFELKIAPDGKFLSGKLHAGKQLGRGGPSLDPSGAAIRKVRDLSVADFGVNAPRVAADGTFAR